MGNYLHRERWLPCTACIAPVNVPIEGGTVVCPACRTSFGAPPRPDTNVPATAPSDEAARRARLRTQDGKPMLPPPGCEPLASGSDVSAHKMSEAQAIWRTTRSWLEQNPSDVAAAERLTWLTMLLRNTLTDERMIRGLLEGALEVLALPRHRQHMRGHLTRGAAKEHDLASADTWLAGCDPASEDLQADSAYRVSAALLETARGDSSRVHALLGATEEEVPIDDAMDPIAVVLRANAWERLGNLAAAQGELAKFMGRGQAAIVEAIVSSMPPGFNLCTQSIDVARVQAREAIGERAASQSGGATGWILLVAGLVLPIGMIGAFAASGEFEWPMLSVLLLPVILGPISFGMITRARRAKEIAQHGKHARGRIVAVSPTGTKINGTPLMQIDVEVAVEGHPPVVASVRRLMRGGANLVGRDVGVIWHPKYPDELVLEQ